ncbi:MAG: hypothetical protein ABIQ15_05265 [Nocardioides sp.]
MDDDDVRRMREELGETLDELKSGLDDVLAGARQRLDEWDHARAAASSDVTPDVGGAVWDLVRRMPAVIGNSLSGDEERIGRARDVLAGLDERLREAGVELGDGLAGYADRLAGLRNGVAASPPDGCDRSGRGR